MSAKLTIATRTPEFASASDNDQNEGAILAAKFRAAAEWIEGNINIVPNGGGDWIYEPHEIPGVGKLVLQ